jgi:putative spermidine/putrescine transport system substrate-binding protein
MKRRSVGMLLVSFVVGLCAVSMTLVNGPFTNAYAGRDHIVVQTWGGQLGKAQEMAYFEPFAEETGIKVVNVEAGTDVGGKLAAMVRSGNIEWDIKTGNYESYDTKFYNKGLLEEIDYNIVTNTDDLVPGALKPWGVASWLEGVCMVFNTRVFPEGKPQPSSYKDFFDVKKFPGPRAMHNWGGPHDNLSIALMADGVPPDECLPIDFDRAFKMMDKVKPHIKVWYTTGAQLVQALVDEEVVMAISTDGRAKQAIQSGAPIEIVWNQSFYFLTHNCVVKNTPMRDAVMRLLAFCNRPEQQAIFNNHIGYTPSNLKVIRYLHPTFAKQQSTHPDNIGKVFNFMMIKNSDWVAESVEMVDEKWNHWIAQ